MNNIKRPERFLSPKELSIALEGRGLVPFSPKYARLLVRAIREDWSESILLRTYCRLSVAYGWLLTHPEWPPAAAKSRLPAVLIPCL